MEVKLTVRYRKFRGLKLLECIKFVDSEDYQYLHPIHQLLCLHHPKLNRIRSFEKYRTKKGILFKVSEFSEFFSVHNNRISFRNRELFNQQQYLDAFGPQDPTTESVNSIYANHLASCESCNFYLPDPTKKIRVRPKLTQNEKILIAYFIGRGLTNRLLMSAFTISKPTLMRVKKSVKKSFFSRPTVCSKEPNFSSITPHQISRIFQALDENPFVNLSELRVHLKLNVSKRTVHRVLRSKRFMCFRAEEELLISATNFELKKRFSLMMRQVSQLDINKCIFSDEKTIYNQITGSIKVYRQRRARRVRQNGQRLHPIRHSARRRFIFRRNPQTSVKMNLFGFISRFGVGELFSISESVNSEEFVCYLEDAIIPSLIEHYGSNDFYLILDNASFHTSNLTIEYLHRSGIRTVMWPAQTPEYNLIENVWSMLVGNYKQIAMSEGIPNNHQDFAISIFRAWYQITPESIANAYDSFFQRIENFLSQFDPAELAEITVHPPAYPNRSH